MGRWDQVPTFSIPAKALVAALVAALLLPLHPPAPLAAEADSQAVDFALVAELDELTGEHATLFRLYWAFFGRNPDGAGALYWIERQERCHPLTAIAQQFAQGEEFVDRYGRLSDDRFVEQIYRNVLGRRADAGGLSYWTGLVAGGRLTRGEMVLHVSMSNEFRSRHRYPSDNVPARGCRLPSGPSPTNRHFVEASGDVLATVDGGHGQEAITVSAPASIIERAGFHQSTHPGAQAMDPLPGDVPLTTMAGRNRGTHARSAIDVAVHPLVPIVSPVDGRVIRAGNYVLYCRYRDGYVVIAPDSRLDLEVKILHMQDVSVRPGDRVAAGDQIAARATPFPFTSQIDRLTAEPSWPHVHIETVDPTIPRRPSSGSC